MTAPAPITVPSMTAIASEAKLRPGTSRTPAAISMPSRAQVSSTSTVRGAPTPKSTSRLDALTAKDVRRQGLIAVLGKEPPDQFHPALVVRVGGLDRVVEGRLAR